MTITGEAIPISQPFMSLSLDINWENIRNLNEAMLHYFVLEKADG